MSFRFEPRGLLAIAPQAYGQMYESVAVQVTPPPTPVVAVVSIRGPLMHHPQPWGKDNTPPPDCYDDIRARVTCALQSDAQCVVLSIDSPGGLVNGCFETARTIQAMAAAAGKPLYAYIDGQCCSAAYALACACVRIYAPETAIVGSVGVLDCMVDATKADGQLGLKFQLISSGARKTDGNVHAAMTDDAVAAAQGRVDDLASFFFSFVADNRDELTADAVRELQAETFTGTRALTLHLVDGVLTLDTLIASLTTNPQGPIAMADKKASALMTALVAAMSSDDPDEKAAARKAMAAICAEDKEEKPSEAAASEEEEPPAKDDDKKKEEDEKAAKAAATVASATASAATAPVVDTSRTKMLEARAVARKVLLDSRPDLSPEMLAVFRDPKQTPLEALRAILPTIAQPVGATTAAALAATQAAPPTVTVVGAGEMTAERKAWNEDMDRAQGIDPKGLAPRWEGTTFVVPYDFKKGDKK